MQWGYSKGILVLWYTVFITKIGGFKDLILGGVKNDLTIEVGLF